MGRIQGSEDGAENGAHRAAQIAEGSRSLRNGVITLGVFCVIVVALLFGIPGLRSAGERITDANPLWVTGGVLLELLSCAGYVVLFDLVFGLSERWVSARLALAELAVNSAVSLSGVAGLALGAWVLRGEGMSAEQIAKRSVVIFLLTSAASVAAVIVIGVPMWLGLFKGSGKAIITLGPAALSLMTVGAVLALARRARRVAGRLDSYRHKRLAVALTGVGWGVLDTLRVIREHDRRLLGAVAYWLFDNLVLYACICAFGRAHAPSIWAVAMAYLVGMVANSLPIPGGLVAVEGGLVGMLLLFGVRPGSEVLAAVLIYRAISLWIPALVGSAAFVSLRRELARPLAVIR